MSAAPRDLDRLKRDELDGVIFPATPVASLQSGRRAVTVGKIRISAVGGCLCSVRDPYTQIVSGLEQLVMLTRMTFDLQDRIGIWVDGINARWDGW